MSNQVECSACGKNNTIDAIECIECLNNLALDTRFFEENSLTKQIIKKIDLIIQRDDIEYIGYFTEIEIIETVSLFHDFKQIEHISEYLVKKRQEQIKQLLQIIPIDKEIILVQLSESNGHINELQSNKLNSFIGRLNETNTGRFELITKRYNCLELKDAEVLANMLYAEMSNILKNKELTYEKCLHLSTEWLKTKASNRQLTYDELLSLVSTETSIDLFFNKRFRCLECNSLSKLINLSCECSICIKCLEKIINESNSSNIIQNLIIFKECNACNSSNSETIYLKELKKKIKSNLSDEYYSKFIKLMIEVKELELASLIKRL